MSEHVPLREFLEMQIKTGFDDVHRRFDRVEISQEKMEARLSAIEQVMDWFTGTKRLLLLAVPLAPALGFIASLFR